MNSLLRLARTEWLKIRYYKPFWVLAALYPVSLLGVIVVALWAQTEFQGLLPQGAVRAAKLPFSYPQVWHNVAYIGSWLHFIPALMIILNVTNEFTFRCHRQNLLDGWSRALFLSAKLFWVVALASCCTGVVMLLSAAAGLVSGSAFSLTGFSYIGLFYLQAIFYGVFVLFLAFWIRRATLTVAAYLIYSAILENILSFLLNLKVQGLGGCLPLKVANALVPFSLLQDKAPAAAKGFLSNFSPSILVLATGFYLVLMLAAIGQRFRREDL